jgi:replicative DNA helicase
MTEQAFPQNIEAEYGVLGSLIIDPEAIALVADFLTPEDFYRDAHRTLYDVILALYEKRQPADFITLNDELERQGKLKDIGGPGYITGLCNQVPTSGNAEYYARIVAQKALYRRLIHVAGRIAASAYGEETDALEQAEQAIFALGQHGAASDFTPIGAVMNECMETLSIIHDKRGSLLGVPTGFRYLDTALSGLQPSDLIIGAGRPGTGKTSFALSIAANAAYKHQHRVAIFSLEMGKQQLGVRLLSMMTQINQQRLRTGWVHDEEWEHLVTTMGTLSTGHIWIDDTAAITLTALRSKARRLQAQHGLDLLIVDYLQLMRAMQEGKRYSNREQEIAEISRGLKGIAKELGVPVLALAQLSRAVENRSSKVPQLSDLRESGAIENDADVVLFIYRDELYNPEAEESKNTADIIIAKHRNGPTGEVRLGFEASQTRFYDIDYSPSAES